MMAFIQYCQLILAIFCLQTFDLGNADGIFLSGICESVVPKNANYHLANYSTSPFYLIQSSNHFKHGRPILGKLSTPSVT